MEITLSELAKKHKLSYSRVHKLGVIEKRFPILREHPYRVDENVDLGIKENGHPRIYPVKPPKTKKTKKKIIKIKK